MAASAVAATLARACKMQTLHGEWLGFTNDVQACGERCCWKLNTYLPDGY